MSGEWTLSAATLVSFSGLAALPSLKHSIYKTNFTLLYNTEPDKR